ncbi:WD_REPEATS_REGION domain-containing protein [Pseudozyma hubeiensis]|nr:WD_REPEATS_REGION domain-containing protein [Pseudozyma hubeiensis]
MQTTSQLCLACSSTIPPNAKPASIYVHGCCSRPVCENCVVSNPRLITFCPICEDAHAAFRKGPRGDVTRKGEVVFDFDSVIGRQEHKEEEGVEPPPYSEEREEEGAGKFVIDAGDEEGEVVKEKRPALLMRQASKSVAEAEVDVAPQSAALATEDTSSDSNLTSIRRKVDPHNTASSTIPSSSTSSTGSTRQYYLRKTDTLQSIAIRFSVSSNELCLLNSLPRAVLSTSPHLLHTRSFILLPSQAVEKQLASNPDLLSSLEGPPRRSAREKTTAARRTAEAKFRASLAKSAGETPADERAARAYVGLAEDEMRWVDFGEGVDGDGLPRGYEREVKGGEGEDAEMWEAQMDTARRLRFDAILKHALGKWEMDSDWERAQRAKGLDPTGISKPLPHSNASMPTHTEHKGTVGKWFSRALTSHAGEPSALTPQSKPRHTISLSSPVKLPTLLSQTLPAHRSPINVVRYNSTGRYLLTGSSDRSVKLWNAQSSQRDAKPIQTYTEHNHAVLAIDISSDNSRFVSAGEDRSIFVWDVASGSVVRRFSGHVGKVNDVRFGGKDAEGSVIVAGGLDGFVRAYDLRAANEWRPIMQLAEAKDSITSIHVSHDKIYSGSTDGVARCYDLRAGQLRSDTLSTAITSVVASKLDSSMLVATMDSTVRLIDSRDGTMLQEYRGHRHEEYRCRAVFSGGEEDGVVVGDEGGELVGWDLVSGERVSVGQKDGEGGKVVLWVEFNPVVSGEMVSAGADGIVRIWNTASG